MSGDATVCGAGTALCAGAATAVGVLEAVSEAATVVLVVVDCTAGGVVAAVVVVGCVAGVVVCDTAPLSVLRVAAVDSATGCATLSAVVDPLTGTVVADTDGVVAG